MLMLKNNKRGVSIVVSYVLLIVLSLSVAAWVFGWLKSNVNLIDSQECPEDVVVQISNINYDSATDLLNLTIVNKGLFDIYGYRVRVGTDPNLDFGVYTLDWVGHNISVQGAYGVEGINCSTYNVSKDGSTEVLSDDLTIVEVQPYIKQDGIYVFCKRIATERV